MEHTETINRVGVGAKWAEKAKSFGLAAEDMIVADERWDIRKAIDWNAEINNIKSKGC